MGIKKFFFTETNFNVGADVDDDDDEKGSKTINETATLRTEFLMNPVEYPHHCAYRQHHRYITDSLRIIGGCTEYRQIVVYVGVGVDAFVLMFDGEVDIDDCLSDSGWR